MKKILILSLILILVIYHSAMAQQRDLWTTFSTDDGLTNNSVLSICESHDGAFWFGTEYGGVSCYESGVWMTFTTVDGLGDNRIDVICESSAGALWFGTFGGGASRYESGEWTTFTTVDGLASNYVDAICESSDGALWFGTGGGVSRYVSGVWTTFTTADGLASNSVDAICESSDGALWFGLYGGGVSRYESGAWTTFTKADVLADNYIYAIYESSDGALWFGTYNGISRYESGVWTNYSTVDGLADNDVCAICESSDGTLWFGTRGGVSRYVSGVWTTFTTADGLANNYVHAIRESSDGALWFGTDDGVSRYESDLETTFTTAHGLASNKVYVICQSNDGALWFGTLWGGVSRYESGVWTTFTNAGLTSYAVRAIYESSNGALWFGIDLSGIVRYESGVWTEVANGSIYAICESSDGALWFGTDGGGVRRYLSGVWTTFTTADGLASNSVDAICESSDGALWFGLYGGGVSRYESGAWTTFTDADGLANNYVHAIRESSDGALWFGTYNGISRYESGVWTTFTITDGLGTNQINAICESSDGALWFGTGGGGAIRYISGVWKAFTTVDGLANNYILDICESKDGALWLGYWGAGAVRLRQDKTPPFTFIRQGPSNQTIGIQSPLFVFRGFDYRTKLDQLVYSFAILDTSVLPETHHWSSFSEVASIQTLPLQNGTYTFYVRARDKWGNIDPTPATRIFTVDITPPTLVISTPKQQDHIKGKYAITGSAFDNSPIHDFDRYKLKYSTYVSDTEQPDWQEDRFSDLKSSEIRNDTLGFFNTIGLEDGRYQLQLWGIDTLKHENEDQVLVTIDNTLPQVMLNTPESDGTDAHEIKMKASLSDINLNEYRLEYHLASQPQWQLLHQDSLDHSVQDSLLYTWKNISDSGIVILKLTGWDKAGNFSADTIQFLFDNVVTPQLEITSPKPGELISGDKVMINATITDLNLDRFRLEYRLPYHNQGQFLHDSTLTQSIENQLIHTWENIKDSGNVVIKLAAWDKDGHTTSTSVQFHLDNKDYQLPTAIISQPMETAFVHDWVSIRGYATDKEFTRYLISLKNSTLDTVLIESDVKKENEELLVFDTRTFLDNAYQLVLTVWNDRQYHKTSRTSIIIDNTAPVAEITSPLSDTISCFTQIQGAVEDLNLDNFRLSYAKVGITDTSKFTQIDTAFTYWNTMGLNGLYTLYLTAQDKAGLNTVAQRSYYINNFVFDKRNGLHKQQDEVNLYIPPNGYLSSVICIEKRSPDEFDFNPSELTPTDLIFEIHSSVEEQQFKKPGVLTINCAGLNLHQLDENKLAVFKLENSEWQLVGGSLVKAHKIISTTIQEIGIYGIFENKNVQAISTNDFELTCQPRVFSPDGGGYDTKTAISFYLSEPSSVTIKAYNLSGRLKRCIVEGSQKSAGMNVVDWNGRDEDGHVVASGLYIVTIESEGEFAKKTVSVLNK